MIMLEVNPFSSETDTHYELPEVLWYPLCQVMHIANMHCNYVCKNQGQRQSSEVVVSNDVSVERTDSAVHCGEH